MARKMLTGVDLNNQKATNVADPSNPGDAVNLQYLLNFVRGLIQKDAVRAATTANISLAAPGASIDGVTMALDDRFLAKDQSTASERGIYLWKGASTPAVRALDADTGTELRPGTTVYVTEGTANADKSFSIISDAAITIGTTAMTWAQTGGAGMGGSSYTQALGIIISGSTIAIDTSIVARTFEAAVPNSVNPSFTHGFGKRGVEVTVVDTTNNWETVDCDIFRPDANTVQLGYVTAPAANAHRVLIKG